MHWTTTDEGQAMMGGVAVHFPWKARIIGPVGYSWMYPIERSLRYLKQYVRNKARPEGSIAEAYVINESLNFCSMYLHGIETMCNRGDQNNDNIDDEEINNCGLSIFSQHIRWLGGAVFRQLTPDELEKSHWYILNNCDEVEPYLQEHMRILESSNGNGDMYKKQHLEFPTWFKAKAQRLHCDKFISDDLYALACGSNDCARSYSGCIANGVRFHTKDRDSHRTTQNSGVMVSGSGKAVQGKGVCEEVEIQLDKWTVKDEFLWLELGDVDIILGMQWLYSLEGVEVDPKKIKSVAELPCPTNVREVRGFLGLTVYYRSEVEEAFEKLKKAMVTLPVLALPDFSLPFVIETDASGYGIEAVLIQTKWPIAFYRHTLAMRDRAKPVYERELMIVVFAIQRLRPYMLGTKFMPELENKAANALSRLPSVAKLYNLIAPTIVDLETIKEELKKDHRLQKIIAEMSGLGDESKGSFSIQHGILKYKNRLNGCLRLMVLK
ncbi:uncharacterized protein E6C27_scaffold223G00070 [Cucumis melo var. makuwa]|uniref:Reverse transcriptase/retrotransposon-derived protein RNase H-like domain-containing protein n=1 Tax=Cucumis melo var. makuwa TaxID=1194695 RepID=A0A5A7SMR8_CUCMM|nr:uncharacterized protein E6C27_scaffold223G00070 [Cucumis melo var. makuwa]